MRQNNPVLPLLLSMTERGPLSGENLDQLVQVAVVGIIIDHHAEPFGLQRGDHMHERFGRGVDPVN